MKLSEMPNIPTRIVAELLGKNEQWVRLGLQRNQLPIGVAIQTSTQYSYHISYEQLKKYIGEERIKTYENQMEKCN